MILPAPVADGSDSGNPPRRAVFVSDFLHIERAFKEVAPELLDEAAPWLVRMGRPTGAEAGGEGIVTVIVRIRLGSHLSSPAVAVTAGPPRLRDHDLIVPLCWEPLSLGQLLPKLDGDLELSETGPTSCRLSLSGRYRAPLGQVGHGLDRVAMHHVAEACARRFLQDVEVACAAS